jgi:hypothetical protein
VGGDTEEAVEYWHGVGRFDIVSYRLSVWLKFLVFCVSTMAD